jgi:hypothetical protein
MTVPASSGISGTQPGNGSNTLWQFDFSIALADEVSVYFINSSGASALVDPDDYAVSFTPGVPGGTVSYPLTGVGLVQEGEAIVIALDPAFDQPVDLKSQGHYSPEVVEDGFDHLERQIQTLRARSGQFVTAPPGVSVAVGTPIDGAHIKWTSLADGSWRLDSATEAALGVPIGTRVLYADDLGLRGDGTDETVTINAKLLEYDGQNVVIFLRSKAGYWPISGQLKNRSSIQLGFGSPLHFAADASVAMVGNYARAQATDVRRSRER